MFTNVFNFLWPKPQRFATIPPYDPRLGPVITKAMWTEQMLTGELTADQLRNVVNPADFLKARLARVRKPTKAVWIDPMTNRLQADVNPGSLSSREHAEAMDARLRSLGYSGRGVHEVIMENPFSVIDWRGETRRFYYVGPLQAGALVERYAKYPREAADQITKSELAELRRA